jgi:hypothetical protein
MALKIKIELESGVKVADSYCRVERISLTKDKIDFFACYYVSANKPCFFQKQHSALYALDGGNPIKQAYEHLKTLPEFQGAIDC